MPNAPSKQSYSALVFTQNAVDRYYTNWSAGYNDGNAHTPLPGLQVQYAPNTGSLREEQLKITFSIGNDVFLDSLITGLPIAPVYLNAKIVIEEIGPGAAPGSRIVEFGNWRLMKALRNPEQRRGLGRLEFLSHKARLFPPLGISAMPSCAWNLGDKTCTVDTVALQETGTVSFVGRKSLRLTNPADSGVISGKNYLDLSGPDDKYWHRGYVELDGLRIGIRDWNQAGPDPYLFQMVRQPPPSWVGQVVTLTPGCDKTPFICDKRYANLEQFGGFGYAIPAYHPVLEIP